MNVSKNHYSASEVADLLKKSRMQVNLDIRLGKIKAEKIGKSYIISAKEVKRLLK